MEKAPDHELGLCPIGKLDLGMMKTAISWGESQLFLQGFVGGRIDPEQIGRLNFVTQKKPATLEDQLRVFLRQKLPEYMVPGRFVCLDTLPLTPNGKLDRKALPSFDVSIRQEVAEVQPVTDTERAIAEIVAEVLELNLAQTGMHSNFFDLGADSVGIVRMNNRLAEEFGREIPIVDMFRYPTISFLASFLGENGARENTVGSARKRAEQIRRMRQRRGAG
jgi:acyl carrier protein